MSDTGLSFSFLMMFLSGFGVKVMLPHRMRLSQGNSNVNEKSHIVGCLLYPENQMWDLCGSVTWFGELTYSIGLAKGILPILPGLIPDITTVSIFDNTTREITTDDSIFIYCGRTKNT